MKQEGLTPNGFTMTLNGESLIPLALGLFFIYLARGGDWKESTRPQHMRTERREIAELGCFGTPGCNNPVTSARVRPGTRKILAYKISCEAFSFKNQSR